MYLANLCGALESLDSGTTSLLDHSHYMNSPTTPMPLSMDSVLQRFAASFCRTYGNPVFTNTATSDGTALVTDDPDWRHEDAKRFRSDKFPFNSPEQLFRLEFAPTEAERTPMEQAIAEVEIGRSLGAAVLTAHVAMGA